MKSYRAKLEVAEAFVALAEEMPIDKVTVGMVAERVGRHRKTFYYHFADKEELIVWLFRYDLARGITQEFPVGELVFEPEGEPGAYPDLPFYVRNVLSDGRLYHAAFFFALSRSLEHRRSYYRRVFSYRGTGSIEDYLYRLYCPQIKRDIAYLAARELDRLPPLERAERCRVLEAGAGTDFLAEFFTGAFIERIVKRLVDEPAQRSLDDVRPFENIIHDSLELLFAHVVRPK